MPDMNYEFEQFFNRDGFNRSLGHFKAVSNLLEDFEDHYNLADILNSLLSENEIQQNQLSPILYALLADKYGYRSISHNMSSTLEDFGPLIAEVKQWKGVDIIIAYHHPELGFSVLNPKNQQNWQSVQSLKRNELVIVYAGAFDDDIDSRIANAALNAVISFLDGKKKKTPETVLKGKLSFKPFIDESEEDEQEIPPSVQTRAAPTRPKSKREPVKASANAPAATSNGEAAPQKEAQNTPAVSETAAPPAQDVQPSGNKTMTPQYSVPVTNELFHNGNVEAWKKIIQSYQVKNPGCEVFVFYDGERIHDINTLFKWGKVKHGSAILFAVVGTEIGDVAKLQRYLRQGASPQFEAFLRFPVNTVLKLF